MFYIHSMFLLFWRAFPKWLPMTTHMYLVVVLGIKNLRKKSPLQKLKDNLVGPPSSTLPICRLPTVQTLLARILGIRQKLELEGKRTNTIPNTSIADMLVTEIIDIWERAAIPVIRKDKIKAKLLKIINEFELKIINCKRDNLHENPEKLDTYKQSIKQLFDIAPSNLEALSTSTLWAWCLLDWHHDNYRI